MNVTVLAAGYATRLYPLTIDRPKALLKVGSKNLIDHLMDNVKNARPKQVAVVTNHRFAGAFEAWAKASSGLKISVWDDGTTDNDNRLGAIGDLKFVIDKAGLAGDDLMVLASDNLFDASLADFVKEAAKRPDAVSIGVYDIGDPSLASKRYGVVEMDKNRKVIRIDEKPEKPRFPWVSMGVYYFGKNILPKVDEYLNSGAAKDAPGHFVIWLLDKVGVYGVPFSGRWFDIGSHDQLEHASRTYEGAK